MKPMAEKYIFVFLSLSTTVAFATPDGAGAPGSEPSTGV
jgi:hypothetical protein